MIILSPSLPLQVGHVPVCLQELMMACWSQEPEQRPTMQHVMEVLKQPKFPRVFHAMFFQECFSIFDACVCTVKPKTDVGDLADPGTAEM